jgi:hypothetical protein
VGVGNGLPSRNMRTRGEAICLRFGFVSALKGRDRTAQGWADEKLTANYESTSVSFYCAVPAMAKTSFLCENRVGPICSLHQSTTALVGTALIASPTVSMVA